jgi:uncharacterized protein (DUF1810 family)
MTYDLERFLEAQDPVYASVLEELRRGRKVGHWMWFIFPQVAGLGQSPMSQRYAIGSRDEAREYLAHPVLGARLRECAQITAAIRDRSAEEVFGPIDARKLRSSTTLFHLAGPGEPVFTAILDRYFNGTGDAATETILGASQPAVGRPVIPE